LSWGFKRVGLLFSILIRGRSGDIIWLAVSVSSSGTYFG